jgi:hypothetical protein
MEEYNYGKATQPQFGSQLPPRTLHADDRQLHRRWRRRGGWAIATFVFMICLTAYLTLLPTGAGGKGGPINYSQCDNPPANSFQGFVAINFYLFTGLGFATAKTIDVIVDLIVGQGGRALHAWIAYAPTIP